MVWGAVLIWSLGTGTLLYMAPVQRHVTLEGWHDVLLSVIVGALLLNIAAVVVVRKFSWMPAAARSLFYSISFGFIIALILDGFSFSFPFMSLLLVSLCWTFYFGLQKSTALQFILLLGNIAATLAFISGSMTGVLP